MDYKFADYINNIPELLWKKMGMVTRSSSQIGKNNVTPHMMY